jgi:hypothetical protein
MIAAHGYDLDNFAALIYMRRVRYFAGSCCLPAHTALSKTTLKSDGRCAIVVQL